jgi:hypothetical protein
MSLAVRDLPNDIKGVKLQPLSEITTFRVIDIKLSCLFQEQLGRIVDKGLVLDQG